MSNTESAHSYIQSCSLPFWLILITYKNRHWREAYFERAFHYSAYSLSWQIILTADKQMSELIMWLIGILIFLDRNLTSWRWLWSTGAVSFICIVRFVFKNMVMVSYRRKDQISQTYSCKMKQGETFCHKIVLIKYSIYRGERTTQRMQWFIWH